ncbi:MAG: hypothetical protein A2W91_04135 [Bacteroidetes bacterium GWF2_38_335]|nr:MAG: hypothetical protein A2W91_04135 [Bacteroidetes bacterium GWF2_38_335]OFY79140.1 MAG: hypothetical protein A2281_03470 [Bacteroidetes bacterium RIFOXYA12_FULL_38_20]HBS88773.1 hypothetical protein [Bacteroidales bacterium]
MNLKLELRRGDFALNNFHYFYPSNKPDDMDGFVKKYWSYNKVRIQLFLVFALSFCVINSSGNKQDTLLYGLKSAKNYKDTIDQYLKASKALNFRDVDKSIEYCDIAYRIAEENDYPEGIGLVYSHKGAAFFRKNDGKEQAKDYLLKALKILKKYNSSEIAFTYNALGNYYLSQNEPVTALETYLTGVGYAEKLNNEEALSSLYINISNVYKIYKKWEDAKIFAKKALILAKKTDNKRYLIFSHTHLGDIYNVQDSLETALSHYNSILKIYEQYPLDVSICGAYSGIAQVYKKKKNPDEAIRYYEKSLDVAVQFNYSFMIANVYEFISNFYFEQGNYEKAIETGNKFLENARKINSSDFETKAAKTLSLSYEKTGNIAEAYKFNKVFLKNDSIFQEKLSELNTSIFDNEIKKRETEMMVEKQKTEIEILNARERERKWVIILLVSLIIFLAIVIIGSVIFYFQRIKLKNFKIKQINSQHKEEQLSQELEFKKKEMENLALLIIEKNNFMQQLRDKLTKLKKEQKESGMVDEINQILLFTSQNMNLTEERKELNIYLNTLYQDFYYKLSQKCPELNDYYKRFAVFLRLNFETKEIASVLNISLKSVSMSKYRIRKKLNLPDSQDLSEFFSNI